MMKNTFNDQIIMQILRLFSQKSGFETNYIEVCYQQKTMTFS